MSFSVTVSFLLVKCIFARSQPGVIPRGTDMERKTPNGHLADSTEPVNYVAAFASAAANHDLSSNGFPSLSTRSFPAAILSGGFARSSIDHNHHILVCCTDFFFDEVCCLLAHDRADLLAHRCRLLNARTSNSRANGPTAYT